MIFVIMGAERIIDAKDSFMTDFLCPFMVSIWDFNV